VKDRFVLVVEAEGRDGPPVIIRLRKFLKCALRSFGIRCVSIRPETPPDPPGSKGSTEVNDGAKPSSFGNEG